MNGRKKFLVQNLQNLIKKNMVLNKPIENIPFYWNEDKYWSQFLPNANVDYIKIKIL